MRDQLVTMICLNIVVIVLLSRRDPFNPLITVLKAQCLEFVLMYENLTWYRIEKVPRNLNRCRRTIANFEEVGSENCYNTFRFHKADLAELFGLLKFPHWMRVGVATDPTKLPILTGEEVFLMGLNRLCSSATDNELSTKFGICWSVFNRAFHSFLEHMIKHWLYLLTDMLEFWMQYTGEMAEYVAELFNKKTGLQLPPRLFRVACFLDCTVVATCRPGGGPAADGPNAPRWNNFI
jgi:hypothetical protein